MRAFFLQVGNWSRWLTDMFGIDADDVPQDQDCNDGDDRRGGDGEPKSFLLLKSLSDFLMLPKDMLMDRSIRKEVDFITSSHLYLNYVMLFMFSLICTQLLI